MVLGPLAALLLPAAPLRAAARLALPSEGAARPQGAQALSSRDILDFALETRDGALDLARDVAQSPLDLGSVVERLDADRVAEAGRRAARESLAQVLYAPEGGIAEMARTLEDSMIGGPPALHQGPYPDNLGGMAAKRLDLLDKALQARPEARAALREQVGGLRRAADPAAYFEQIADGFGARFFDLRGDFPGVEPAPMERNRFSQRGYALFPAGDVISELKPDLLLGEINGILASRPETLVADGSASRSITIYKKKPAVQDSGWHPLGLFDVFKPVFGGLAERVHRVYAGGELVPNSVVLRLDGAASSDIARAEFHEDGLFLRLLLALVGPGPWLADGGRIFRGLRWQAALIAGYFLEEASLGEIPASLHSSPLDYSGPRALLAIDLLEIGRG